MKRTSKHFSFRDPTVGPSGISKEKIKKLYDIYPEAALFTSIDTHDFDGTHLTTSINSDTDSCSENEDNEIPEPVTSLYDPACINLIPEQLAQLSSKRYEEFSRTYSQQAYDNLCGVTTMQGLSNDWMVHRAGRITASKSHSWAHTKLEKPSQSLIHTTMQYDISRGSDNKYTRHGRVHESAARDEYTFTLHDDDHHDVTVTETGLHVNAIRPFLGASPDGIVSCSCHGKRLLEIKCPYKYQNGFNGCFEDKDFPLTSQGVLKSSHPYYYQVQLQMFVCDFEKCDFFMYASTSEDYFKIEVCRDDTFFIKSC